MGRITRGQFVGPPLHLVAEPVAALELVIDKFEGALAFGGDLGHHGREEVADG
ncbi:hypothetical protein AB0F68_14755 [Micromonospora sp. NPDC023966]|uniref:hypothetical protein n=1 Tax=Micromonospora sp. NPDC023966 TaxID=3154699 RepID=UPI0033D22DFC